MVSLFSQALVVGLTLAVGGCASNGILPAGDAPLEPMVFFTGRTRGDGLLDKLFSSSIKVSVDSVGRIQDHTLILDQTIREGQKPPRIRRWTMRRVSSDRYSGTLTDAVGPVQVSILGPRATIRYRMRSGLNVEQQLALQTDRKTVLNRLDVRKFGAHLATLNETIRKLN